MKPIKHTCLALLITIIGAFTLTAQQPTPTPPDNQRPERPEVTPEDKVSWFRNTKTVEAPAGGRFESRMDIENLESYLFPDDPSTTSIEMVPDENHIRVLARYDSAGQLMWEYEMRGLPGYRTTWDKVLFAPNGDTIIAVEAFMSLDLGPYTVSIKEIPASALEKTLGSSLSVSSAVVMRIDSAGSFVWVEALDLENGHQLTDLSWSDDGQLLLRGRYGRFHEYAPEYRQLQFPDGTVHAVPGRERRDGVMEYPATEWIAKYDLAGNFVWGDVLSNGPRNGYVLTEQGEQLLTEAYTQQGLLFFDATGDVAAIDPEFPKPLYERSANRLVAWWDRYETKVDVKGRFSNGDVLVYGRGIDDLAVMGTKFDKRTYYLAIIDSAGNLQKGVVLDDRIYGDIFVENDQIFVDVLWENAGTLQLGDLMEDFSMGAGAGGAMTVMERTKGPFSGLLENNGWRQSAHFGWVANMGGSWWYAQELDSVVWVSPQAGLSAFWYYDGSSADWRYTTQATFPLSWSNQAGAWVTGR